MNKKLNKNRIYSKYKFYDNIHYRLKAQYFIFLRNNFLFSKDLLN